MFWKLTMLRLKKWDDYRKTKLKNRVFLMFLLIRVVKILFFNFRFLSTFFLFIILLLLLLAILQTIKRNLTNFFRSTSLSTNLIVNLFFSIDCWKFRIAYSLTRIIILLINTQLYLLLIVQLKMSLIILTFIAKEILIILFSSNKFLFFCEAFIKTKTRLAMFEKNTRFSKCDLIKLLISFF